MPFIGARPVNEYDLRMQEMSLAQNRDYYDRRQRAAENRNAGQANAAAMAEQARQFDAQQAQAAASQRFAADRASSDAYNARNDAYSTATDPRLAAIERLRQNEALGRESAFANLQSGNRINEHFEGMQDNRAQQVGIDINRARLDAVSTMQKGNIDARLLGLQGQNAQSLAGVNNEFAIKRDAAQSGNAINEDAWGRMQNRKAALMEMEGQEQQAGVTLPKADQDKREALWQEYRLLEDAVDNKEISPKQGLTRMDEITRKLGQFRATMKQVPWNQDPQTLGSIIRQPDGSTITRGPKGEPVYHAPPAGVKPEMVDPAAVMHKRAVELMKAAGINDAVEQKLSYEDALQKAHDTSQVKDGLYVKPKEPDKVGADPQELFRHVQNVNQLAQRSGVPIQQFIQQLGQKNPEAAEAYVAGLRMIQQAQGGPAADPRSGAVQRPAGPGPQSPAMPPQRMVPGQPGPTVDPRLLQMQGQPAQRPFVGENQRTSAPPAASPTAARMDALTQRSLSNDDQQTAGALQAFKTITQKHGGLPPAGSEEEQIVMQAAAFLRKRGIDPTGGVRRKPTVENEGHMSRYGAWNK